MTPPADTRNALRAEKEGLRRTMLHKRTVAAREVPDAGIRMRDHVLRAIQAGRLPFASGTTVSFYIEVHDEIDPWPLTAALVERGAKLCLPTIMAKGMPLVFRAYTPGDALVQGPWQIPQPGEQAAVVYPRLLLVPLVAFDRQGGRLGYGAGFYDRSLSVLRARHALTALGLARAVQEVPRVPTGSGDMPLDAIATEKELIFPRKTSKAPH